VSVTGDGASDWIQSLVPSLPIFVPRLDLVELLTIWFSLPFAVMIALSLN
jgi:hypothetical protein